MLPTGQQAQTLMSSERSSHSDSSAVGVVSSRTSTAGSVATVRCGQKAMQCMAVHSILLVAWQAVVEALDSSIADDAREFEELCVTWNQLRPTVIRQIMGSHQDAVRQVRTMGWRCHTFVHLATLSTGHACPATSPRTAN